MQEATVDPIGRMHTNPTDAVPMNRARVGVGPAKRATIVLTGSRVTLLTVELS
jgi:hypothetical protein